jgi:2-polyprenyl-6-methoxyphenol hydroxylase-like FAD-dependent oxidoreductase
VPTGIEKIGVGDVCFDCTVGISSHMELSPMKNEIRVLVSGASVAGLSIAYWLSNSGFKVTVVERASHLRPGGQALDIRGPALEVAERMGIMASIRERRTKQEGMSIMDFDGREVFRSTERTITGGRFDSSDIEILRDDLCSVLYQVVGHKVEYLFGDSIASLSQDGLGVDVVFSKAVPGRFDLVIGADGLHSGVRQLAFGPEKQFGRYLGAYLSVFAIPNYLELDRWQVFHQHEGTVGGVLGLRADTDARTYIAFGSGEPLDYDYRDTVAQKRLVAERMAGMGWEFPRMIDHMMRAANFHFDSMSQIRMDSWSRGRIVLVGDAGYCVSPMTGQGTTVAMVGAYVLAGELAANKGNLLEGITRYERELRNYADRNQELALTVSLERNMALGETGASDGGEPAGIPDFGQMVQPLALPAYQDLVR